MKRAAAQAEAYEKRIQFQRDRITLFAEFLQERNLIDDFNNWESARDK